MKTKIKQIEGLETTLDGLDTRLSSVESIQTNLKFQGTGTIPTTGWVANTGDYPLKLNLSVAGILSTDWLEIFIANDDLDKAQDYEISPNCDSYDGGITFYAKVNPVLTLSFSYKGLR